MGGARKSQHGNYSERWCSSRRAAHATSSGNSTEPGMRKEAMEWSELSLLCWRGKALPTVRTLDTRSDKHRIQSTTPHTHTHVVDTLYAR